MKPLHIIASYDKHLQQQDLSDFYYFVLIVDLKASSLAIIDLRQTLDFFNDLLHNSHEFLLALLMFIYPVCRGTASSFLVPFEMRL